MTNNQESKGWAVEITPLKLTHVVDTEGLCIAVIVTSERRRRKIASLISAAPELLGSLKNVLEAIKAEHGKRSVEVNFPCALAAIAKAEGTE